MRILIVFGSLIVLIGIVLLVVRQRNVQMGDSPQTTGPVHYVLATITPPRPEVIQPTIAQLQRTENEPKMLSDILALGLPLKCVRNDGVILMANGLLRSDGGWQPDKNYNYFHLISDLHTWFVWLRDDESGWRYNDRGLPHTGYAVGSGRGGVASIDVIDKFHCTQWVPDMSVFDLPKDVVFTDPPRLGGPGM